MAQTKRRKKEAKPLTEQGIYIDPVDEWITENHEEWSRKYPGKYLALVDFKVVAVEETPEAALARLDAVCPERFKETDLAKVPTVWYVPQREELEMLL